MFYQLLSTIKVKLVDKMMLSGYLCVILHVKRIKLAFIAVLTYFVILCKIQDSDHFLVMSQTSSSATTHKIYLSCREDERLSTKAKSFRNTATYKILWGGVPSNSPPHPPFYHGGGMNSHVLPRVNLLLYETGNYYWNHLYIQICCTHIPLIKLFSFISKLGISV